jgi:energy-coupling factor transporter ATP-binding protein EcfA2
MTKLLHNLPIEDLNKENDYLGVIDKANLIQTILENNTEQFHEIKMFALYGEWGSGKSTLMKYLEQNLKDDFNTFFFDTWQFEKDENLPQTLLEYVLKKSEGLGEKISGDILKVAGKLFRGLGKSFKVRIPISPVGGSVEINPSELIDEFTKEDITFYDALQKFKTEFVRWEDNITSKKEKKYNIIFIDDLDRCEPENVLNLLSAIKLFFTYGKKTIFFFGVDKKAVQQAVQTKYNDIIKSEEYLEKIFDISFSMPEHDNVLKLVSTYFDDRSVEGEKLNEKIADFFKELQFTNPRRLKKVLNKYLLLANASEELQHNHPYSSYIGEIFTKDSYGNYFETILSLYFIVVKEFYPELFQTLFDFKLKENVFKTKAVTVNKDPMVINFNSFKDTLEKKYFDIELKKVFGSGLLAEDKIFHFPKLAIVFCPDNLSSVDEDFYRYDNMHDKIFPNEKRVDYYFLKYLCNNVESFNKLPNYSEKSIADIYKGIKQIL